MEQKALKILYLKSAFLIQNLTRKLSLFSSLAKEAKIIKICLRSIQYHHRRQRRRAKPPPPPSFSSKRVRLFSNFERRRGEGFKVRAEPAKPKLKKAVRFTVVVVVVVSNYYRLLTCLFMYAGGIHGWWRRRERLLRRRRD